MLKHQKFDDFFQNQMHWSKRKILNIFTIKY